MNFMTSSTDATLFDILFVLAASAQIHVENLINITLHIIFTFLRYILERFQGSAFKNGLLALL